MGPAPNASAYQQAAQSIYEPQKTAETATLNAAKTADINTLEGGKNQVQTDYQSAIDSLTAQTAKNVGTINQLYTERLGGNFSGLQGNDLGMMFSNANRQQATIESSRANKLSSIAISEANTANKYDTQIGALGSKYQGLEAGYAAKAYDSAVKEYDTQNQRAFTNQLAEERLQLSEQRQNNSAAAKPPAYTLKQGSAGQYMFKDKSGQPASLAEFIQGNNKGGQDVLDLLANGTGGDKSMLSKIKGDAQGRTAIQNEDFTALKKVIAKYDKGNVYGFR